MMTLALNTTAFILIVGFEGGFKAGVQEVLREISALNQVRPRTPRVYYTLYTV